MSSRPSRPASLRERVRSSVLARRSLGDAASDAVAGAGRDGLVDGERASIDRFITEFDRLDDPLSRERDPVHVTGSAIVVGDQGVVLLRHKRLGIWLQPGGHIDAGEAPSEAALREAIEETGLELELVDGELVHVDVHPGGRGHIHLDLRYLVRPVAGSKTTPRPPLGESQEVEWFDWQRAIERASDERLRALLRHLAPSS